MIVQTIILLAVGLCLVSYNQIQEDDGIIGKTGNAIGNLFGDVSENPGHEQIFLTLIGFFLIAIAALEAVFIFALSTT